MKKNTKGAAQLLSEAELKKAQHSKMEAGDDSYQRSGRESIEESISTLKHNALSNPKVYNMTPNVSEEEAKKVREKNERTYLKSSLAGGIVKGTVTRLIKSGSPKMINKLRNIGK